MRYFKRPDNSPFYPEDRSAPYCVEYLNGDKLHYSHDKILHKEDGPAVIYLDGTKNYWLNGKYYGNENTDQSWIRFCRLKAFQ